MKIEVDVTIELELPEGDDPAIYVNWWIGAIKLLAAQESYCVGWQVGWEPQDAWQPPSAAETTL